MESNEQHYYRKIEEQNSNACKLLVKKDTMLDSIDAKERSYNKSTNGIDFTIRKVNLMLHRQKYWTRWRPRLRISSIMASK